MININSKQVYYFYIFVGVLALAFTFSHVGSFVTGGLHNILPNFLNEFVSNLNASSKEVTVDLIFLSLPLMALVVFEGRSIGLKWPWIYMFSGIFVLTSAAVPFFLAARENKISNIDGSWREYQLHFVELITVLNLTILFIGVSAWFIYTS